MLYKKTEYLKRPGQYKNMTAPAWSLENLYSQDSPELTADLAELDEKIGRFAAWRPRLAASPPAASDFRALLEELEALNRLAHRLSGFADLAFAQNVQDQKAQAFLARMDEKMAEMANEILFFEIWWKNLPEPEAAPLAASCPDFAYWLERARARRPHTLPEPEEKILNLKNATGSAALIALYDAFTNRYRFRASAWLGPEDGEEEVGRDELMAQARAADPGVRAAAYRELYRVYGADGPILGQMYQTAIRDWRLENIRLRHYPNPISVRHKANDLSGEAVEALLNAARDQAPLFGEFFRLKARVLGLEKFRRYDLYAPLVEDGGRLDFQAGLDEVLAALESFSPRFRLLAARVAGAGRLHARPQTGKQSGAFCYSMAPGDIPWVLMNYTGRRQDLFTLAHELGHAIHAQLAENHNIFHFHATLPLAETASTFAEMLLADRLRKRAGSDRERADLLFRLLDDAYATVGRQAFFALFEIKAHELTEAGAAPDELAAAYMENLAAQFGPEMEIGAEFRWEWVSIPHFFHTPFYVYAYSFGQLLVYSLWREFETSGADFAARLTALLSRGGSAGPEKILAENGLGPLNENFWLNGFKVIRGFLDELRSLVSNPVFSKNL